MTSAFTKAFGSAIAVWFLGTALYCQLLSDTRKAATPGNGSTRLSLAPELTQRLSKNIVAGPRISFPVQTGPDLKELNPARRGRRLIESGESSHLTPSANSGALVQQSTPATLLGNSTGSLGPERVQATGSPSGMLSPNMAQPARGPVNAGSNPAKWGMAPRPMPCRQPVVSDVNGADGINTIIFLEPGKHYAIHGCGFGAMQGEAYLVGVTYRPAGAPAGQRSVVRFGTHPDWIRLIPAPGADPHQNTTWTDTEIQIVVDPNASGFYDNYWSAEVVVFPTGKPKIQSIDGFGFWAARAEQTLTSAPLPQPGPLNLKQPNSVSTAQTPWFMPAAVSDSTGHFVGANLLSPSNGSLVLPGHTFAVVRDDNSAGFPGKQDVVLLNPSLLNLVNGFQPSGLQLFTAALSPNSCTSASNFSASGNWNTAYAGQYKAMLSWQEQSCGSNGVSAYAVDIKVTGPRGVSP